MDRGSYGLIDRWGAVGVMALALLIGPAYSQSGNGATDGGGAGRLAVPTEGFRTRTTEHFEIVFDTPYREVQELIGRLEGTHGAIVDFCGDLGLPVEPLPDHLQVVLVAKHKDYARLAGRAQVAASQAAGFYDAESNLAVFCSTSGNPMMEPIGRQIEAMEQRLGRMAADGSSREARNGLQHQLASLRSQQAVVVERFNRLVVQHEAAHQVLFNLGVHVRGADTPRWLVEGLACQFEVPQPAVSRGLLHVNHMRLADFREAMTAAPTRRDDAATVAALIADDEAFAGPGAQLNARYAYSWALVFYLHRTQRDALGRYLRALSGRKPGEGVDAEGEIAAFKAHFGAAGGAFERRWLEFMSDLRLDPHKAGR